MASTARMAYSFQQIKQSVEKITDVHSVPTTLVTVYAIFWECQYFNADQESLEHDEENKAKLLKELHILM